MIWLNRYKVSRYKNFYISVDCPVRPLKWQNAIWQAGISLYYLPLLYDLLIMESWLLPFRHYLRLWRVPGGHMLANKSSNWQWAISGISVQSAVRPDASNNHSVCLTAERVTAGHVPRSVEVVLSLRMRCLISLSLLQIIQNPQYGRPQAHYRYYWEHDLCWNLSSMYLVLYLPACSWSHCDCSLW